MLKIIIDFLKSLESIKIISKSKNIFNTFLEDVLLNEGISQNQINNLKNGSIEDLNKTFQWIFHRKYQRKILEKFLGDHYNSRKNIEHKFQEIKSYDKLIILIFGSKFIEFLEKSLEKTDLFEILAHIFFKTLLYDIDKYNALKSLMEFLPSHRYNQRIIFELLNDFIIKYGEKYKDNYDERNEEAVLWSNKISELINSKTNKKFFSFY